MPLTIVMETYPQNKNYPLSGRKHVAGLGKSTHIHRMTIGQLFRQRAFDRQLKVVAKCCGGPDRDNGATLFK